MDEGANDSNAVQKVAEDKKPKVSSILRPGSMGMYQEFRLRNLKPSVAVSFDILVKKMKCLVISV